MLVYLLRHAPTRANLESRYNGSLDQPLAPEGEALAARAVVREDVPLVYTSTRQRAVQTARIMYPRAELRQQPGLDEMCFGAFEGRRWQELESDPAYIAWLASECRDACPGGEDKAGFSERATGAFRECFRRERDAGANELHVLAHGGVIMAVCERFAEPRRPYFDWRAPHCGGYLFDADGSSDRLRLVRELPGPDADGA